VPSAAARCAGSGLDVARAALRGLARVGGPAEARALRERLLRVDIGVVGDYAATLRRLNDHQAAEVAVDALSAEDPRTRQAAAIALRELRASSAQTRLLGALDDSRAAVRRCALEALAALGRDAANARAIATHLLDSDVGVRCAAVEALAAIADDPASMLRTALTDPSPLVRRRVGCAADRLSADQAQALLSDPSAAVREATAARFAEVAAPPDMARSLLASLDDPVWHVRRAACKAVAAMREPALWPSLRSLLIDEHPTVRADALNRLADLADDKLANFLAEGLLALEPMMRRACVYALAERAPAAALNLIARVAGDADVAVRVAVASSLPASSPALGALIQDPDADVRNAARVARTRGGRD
jgi:HEAT repeat protein